MIRWYIIFNFPIASFSGTEIQEIYLENDDDDVHMCRKCNIIFYDVQKYLEHKVKHDNYKVGDWNKE